MAHPDSHTMNDGHEGGETRRDFLLLVTGAFGAVAVGAAIWPLIDTMNPAADVRAASTTEVDLSPIEVGQRVTITWRSKPVFIDRRSEAVVADARKVALDVLPDPETDAERVQKAEWLIVIGICTHLGCIPLGQRPSDERGEYGGWFCPCHGSHYDTAGRIRKGPAPLNLVVPEYTFLTDDSIRIG
jgi:ubiquinol-cytochrome c reductase iron-sulfur subunit